VSSSSTRLRSPEGLGSVIADAHGRSALPTAFEMGESVLLLITGAVLAAPVLPGFTLCVPVLAMLAVVVPVHLLPPPPGSSARWPCALIA
jgi:hypothetical protein